MKHKHTSKKHLSHDAFFKAMMAKPEVASDFLRQYLPAELIEQLDFTTLQQESCEHITPALKRHIGDTLFSLKFNDSKAYICALIEHYSSPVDNIALQVFLYTALTMHKFADFDRDKPIPLVIPLIVYHGKKPYPLSLDIRDYIDAPADLIDYYFNQPYQIIDLATLSDENLLESHLWSGMMQLALKHIKDKDALPFIQFLMQNIVKPLDQVKDADKIELVLTYLANKANIKDKPAFKQLVCESLEPELEETMMSTMVQYWTEEGLQMGIEQGMLIGEEKGKQKWLKKGQLEAQLSVAKELLAENFSQERVARLTKLPLSEIAALARDRVLQTVD